MEGQLPHAFICTFTEEPLVDPVVTSDGHTYSRVPMEHWLRMNPLDPRSPKTNEALGSTQLVPNIAVRQAMDEMRERQPMAIDRDRLQLSDPEELLGEGSYGRVVAGALTIGRARQVRVAVKKMPAMTVEAERAAFQRELKAFMHAARHCDGVCVLHGTCEIDSRVCIVMKRYERSLHAVIVQAGRLEVADVRRNSHALFRTLDQLHECGVVVRDVKPENILVDAYGNLVLSDFGISEVLQTSTHVKQSQIKGTFAYMAPEAFEEAQVGPPVDIWAMACVVLEMWVPVSRCASALHAWTADTTAADATRRPPQVHRHGAMARAAAAADHEGGLHRPARPRGAARGARGGPAAALPRTGSRRAAAGCGARARLRPVV